jgi:hypothetical protein
MSPPGRHGPRKGPSGALGEYRSAQPEGIPVSAPGRSQALIPERAARRAVPISARSTAPWQRRRRAAALTAVVRAAALGTALSAALCAANPAAAAAKELAVCADPSALPYSNTRGEGFENRIARLLADDPQRDLRYVWNMQRRGFLRRTLNAGFATW